MSDASTKKYRIVNAPGEHRFEGELRVCDPEKTDHTKDVESWRVFKIMAEFVEGFEMLRKYKLAATFFGSARTKSDDPIYLDAVALSSKLAKSGFTVVSGGASGVMEAASKGAFEAEGKSVGLNIVLPNEQAINPYLTDAMTFNYFFSRKVMLSFASEVYIFFPGGFGTLDECLEILTLVQTKKIKRVPIILYNKDFWQPFLDVFETHLADKYQTISRDDLNLYEVADSVDEAYEKILKSVKC